VGHEVAVGYFSQDHKESIQPGVRCLNGSMSSTPWASQQELRGCWVRCYSAERTHQRTENLRAGKPRVLCSAGFDAAETEFPAVGRGLQPLGSGIINALNIACRSTMDRPLVTHDHDVVDEVATRNLAFR